MGGELTVDAPSQGTSAAHQRLSETFDAHHRRLYLLARRLSNGADEAKDLVQETFLRAARSWRVIPAGAEEAWLVRVLISLCRDRWKQAATRAYAAGVALTAVVVAGAWWHWHSQDSLDASRQEAIASVRPEPVRELYFTTPEGIRVIWTFNPSTSE